MVVALPVVSGLRWAALAAVEPVLLPLVAVPAAIPQVWVAQALVVLVLLVVPRQAIAPLLRHNAAVAVVRGILPPL